MVVQRGGVKAELFRMASSTSTHTIRNHELLWRYRSIRNPYIRQDHKATGIPEENDDPIIDAPNVQPLAPAYDGEIYSSNRLLAFERDGWKCTRCGSRDNLQAHHIQPVPKRRFDPTVVHRSRQPTNPVLGLAMPDNLNRTHGTSHDLKSIAIFRTKLQINHTSNS